MPDLTRGVINGSGSNAHLSENGERLMRLLDLAELTLFRERIVLVMV